MSRSLTIYKHIVRSVTNESKTNDTKKDLLPSSLCEEETLLREYIIKCVNHIQLKYTAEMQRCQSVFMMYVVDHPVLSLSQWTNSTPDMRDVKQWQEELDRALTVLSMLDMDDTVSEEERAVSFGKAKEYMSQFLML